MERAASPDEVTYLYRGYGNDLEKLLKLTARRQTVWIRLNSHVRVLLLYIIILGCQVAEY